MKSGSKKLVKTLSDKCWRCSRPPSDRLNNVMDDIYLLLLQTHAKCLTKREMRFMEMMRLFLKETTKP